MDHETTNYQPTNHQFRRLPKGERRVRFADSMGMELVSIFLFDLINNYYFASIHNHHQLPPPKTIPPSKPPSLVPPRQTTTTTTTNSQAQQHHQYENYQNQKNPSFKHTSTIINNSNPPKPAILSRTTLSAANTILSNKLNGINNQNSNRTSQTQMATAAAQQQQHNSISHHDHNHHHHHHLLIQNQQTKQQQQQTQINTSNQTNANTNQTTNGNQQMSFICEFTQPISLISFKERVKINKVHLETCSVNSIAGNTSISCTIRVLNQSYDKSVIVRYTTDEWHTHTDSLASYKPGSCEGWSDKFTSTFSVTNQVKQFHIGQRIMFAVRITYDGDKVYWDNNGGLNYTIKRV